MYMPAVRGVIERRILVNYRIDPDWASRLLPAPFRPSLVDGNAIAGLCLVRLARLRPRGLPALLNARSENAAHRIAVEWQSGGEWRRGVYVWRRDTHSHWKRLAGGRIFPGVHQQASFVVREDSDRYQIDIESLDGQAGVSLDARVADWLPADSAFRSTAEASEFFRAGAIGYSRDRRQSAFEGLHLETFDWNFQPLETAQAKARFFDDPDRFPRGTIAFDSAFLMRNVEHEWRLCPSIADCEGRE